MRNKIIDILITDDLLAVEYTVTADKILSLMGENKMRLTGASEGNKMEGIKSDGLIQ